jgi:hypothetical protein
MAEERGPLDENRFLRYAREEMRHEEIRRFAAESDRIEGIDEDDERHKRHVVELELLLERPKLAVVDLQNFVANAQPGAKIRDRKGRNVSIMRNGVVLYRPPEGGIQIVGKLEELLEQINRGEVDPGEAHAAYESLHPFTDGNGRSGRAVWAWHMKKIGENPFGLGFLHLFYYQALELARRQVPAGS